MTALPWTTHRSRPPTPAALDAPTLVDALRRRAGGDPDRIGIRYLGHGHESDAELRYAELDHHARRVGATLQRLLEPGETALLLHPPGLDYVAAFFGCLYGGVVGVPVYPPEPRRLERTLARLLGIVSETRTRVALTTRGILAMKDALLEIAPELGRLTWVATDSDEIAPAESWCEPDLREETTAFIQYTSGSTSAPRGVVLSHANLMHNVALMCEAADMGPGEHCVSWLPTYHDMGLIGNILTPVVSGVEQVLMSPIAFLRRPLRWLETMSELGATVSGGPNFAFDLCVRRTTPEQRRALDLSRWRVAYSGAEPVRAETLERFREAFAPSGFRPEAFLACYGLAEATLMVCAGAPETPPRVLTVGRAALERGRVEPRAYGDPGSQRVVGCGRVVGDQELLIVDPDSRQPLPEGRVGEVWVRGKSVAEGYWEQPRMTREVFGATPAGSERADAGYLRTGDLGFVFDEQLFVTSRLKDLVIVRGRNLAPQDIEEIVDGCHPAVRPGCGAAFSVEVDGEERLVVALEIDSAAGDAEEVGQAVRDAIGAELGLSPHAVLRVAPRSIPKTSSGKIQRGSCRQAFLDGTLGKGFEDARGTAAGREGDA